MRRLAVIFAIVASTGCTHAALPHAVGLQGSFAASARLHRTGLRPATRAERPLEPNPTRNGSRPGNSLETRLYALFQANFVTLDRNHDGVLTLADFDVPAAHFVRVFAALDANHDGTITPLEYFGPARAADVVSGVQSRAAVSALGVGGHVTLDKAQFMFDVYLQDRIIDQAERAQAIQDAFEAADDSHTKVLKEPELEVALAILEARADLRHLQHVMGQDPPNVPADPAASAAIAL